MAMVVYFELTVVELYAGEMLLPQGRGGVPYAPAVRTPEENVPFALT